MRTTYVRAHVSMYVSTYIHTNASMVLIYTQSYTMYVYVEAGEQNNRRFRFKPNR